MSSVYSEDWFELDVEQMGNMFKFCESLSKEIYGQYLDVITFLTDFMNSRCRRVMEEGQECGYTWLLSMDIYDVFKRYVAVDLNNDISKYISQQSTIQNYAEGQLDWVGQAYAHLHWELELSSKVLVDVMPIEKMLDFYWTAHEISFHRFIEKSLWMYQEKGLVSKSFKFKEYTWL